MLARSKVLRPILHQESPSTQQMIIGREIDRRFRRDAVLLGPAKANSKTGGDALNDLVLEGEEVFGFAFPAIRPEMLTGGSVNQLGRHPDLLAMAPHAAFDKIARAQ